MEVTSNVIIRCRRSNMLTVAEDLRKKDRPKPMAASPSPPEKNWLSKGSSCRREDSSMVDGMVVWRICVVGLVFGLGFGQ